MKGKILIIFAIIAVIGAVLGTLFVALQSVIAPENQVDYVDDLRVLPPEFSCLEPTCKGEFWEVSKSGSAGIANEICEYPGKCSHQGLVLSGNINIKSVVNFHGYDTRVEGYRLRYDDIGSGRQTITKEEFTIQIKSDPANPNYYETWVNGRFTGGGTDNGERFITFNNPGGNAPSYNTIITSVTFTPPNSCVVGENQFLVYELFGGNREIGKYSTRHAVDHYCVEHPVIIFDETIGGSDTSASPIFTWIKGGTLNIPSTQAWGVFYVANNDGTFPVVCNQTGQYFNENTGRCNSKGGLVTTCSEGNFDPATGECLVDGEIRTTCEFGRYDLALNACVFNPPLSIICSNPDAIYFPDSEKCEFKPEVETICP